MKRRDFLRAATGAAGVAGATGAAQATGSPLAASQANNTTTTTAGNGNGNQTTTTADGGGDGGGGGTVTVALTSEPYAFEGATESPLYIQPGTTVEFVWESDNHNVVVESQPDGAGWEGEEQIYNSGHTYSHTFETTGTYEFYCEPHRTLGMTGTIIVNESGQPPGGGGQATLDPHEMGVPFQAQYVGLATVLMVFVSLVFTFFTLKYGGSPHASAPNKRD